jgi:hypothetical protein
VAGKREKPIDIVRKFRQVELSNGEVFCGLRQAQILIEKAALPQYSQTPWRLGLSPTSAGNHGADRPEADHALAFKLDHPMGAPRLKSSGGGRSQGVGRLFTIRGNQAALTLANLLLLHYSYLIPQRQREP